MTVSLYLNRHVGDLGNIEAGDDGTSSVKIVDSVISLSGPHSIIGRSLVVRNWNHDSFSDKLLHVWIKSHPNCMCLSAIKSKSDFPICCSLLLKPYL